MAGLGVIATHATAAARTPAIRSSTAAAAIATPAAAAPAAAPGGGPRSTDVPENSTLVARQWRGHLHRGAWRDCAVVGASSSLLDARLSDVIDRHTTVVRCNMHTTRGRASAHVGSKTDVYVLGGVPSDSRLQGWLKSRATSVVFPPNNVASYEYTVKRLTSVDARMRQVPLLAARHEVALMSMAVRDLAKTLGVSRPSTGFQTVLLARELCTSVTLFGFQDGHEVDEQNRSLMRHYDSKRPIKETHPFHLEHRLYASWQAQRPDAPVSVMAR